MILLNVFIKKRKRMFNIGMPELLVILVIALIVLGPKRLPDIAKSLAKALNEFKKTTDDIKDSIEKEARNIKDQAMETMTAASKDEVQTDAPKENPDSKTSVQADAGSPPTDKGDGTLPGTGNTSI
jgi:Tat protein translocase TatB subunit